MLKVVETPFSPHGLSHSHVLGSGLSNVLRRVDLLDVDGQLGAVVLVEHGQVQGAGLVEDRIRHSLKGRTYSL